MFPTLSKGFSPSASRSKNARAKLNLSPCPHQKEKEDSSQNEHKLPSINVSIFLNSPVRSAYEKLIHARNSRQTSDNGKSVSSGCTTVFLTELECEKGSLVGSDHASELRVQRRHSNFFMILDNVKEMLNDNTRQEEFNYFIPMRSKDGYGNLYHVTRARNIETQTQYAYLTVSLFGVTQFVDGVPEYFDSIERYKREMLCFDHLKTLKLFEKYRMMKTFGLWKLAFRHRRVKRNSRRLAANWRFDSINWQVILIILRNGYLQLESQMNFGMMAFDFPESVHTFFDKMNTEFNELLMSVRAQMKTTEIILARNFQEIMNQGLATVTKGDPFMHTAMNKIRRGEDIAKNCLVLCDEMISGFHVNIAVSLVKSISQCMVAIPEMQNSIELNLRVEGVEAPVPKIIPLSKCRSEVFKVELRVVSEEKVDFAPQMSEFTERYDAIVACISDIVQYPYKLRDNKSILPRTQTMMMAAESRESLQACPNGTWKKQQPKHEGPAVVQYLEDKLKTPRSQFLAKLYPSFELVNLLSQEFGNHRDTLKKYQSKLGLISHEKHGSNYILYLEDILHEGQMLMEKMRRLSDTKKCGTFLVDCVDAKMKLIMKIPNYLNQICEEMQAHFSSTLKSTLEIASEISEHLVETTTTLQFVSQNEIVLNFRTIRPEALLKKQYSKVCHEVCKRHCENINAVDSAMSSILDETFEKMEFRIDMFEAQYEDNFVKFGSTLDVHDNAIRHHVISLNTALHDDVFDKETDSAYECLSSLAELKIRHDGIVKDIEVLINLQRFFNHPESQFDGVDKMGSVIQFKLMVWNLMTDLNDAIEKLSPQLVEKIDCTFFEMMSKKFQDTISLQGFTSEIFEQLKQRAASFADILKIIKACQCPDLKVEHWDSLETILQIRIDRENSGHSQPFIAQCLFASSAHKVAPEVVEIARAAQNQYSCKIKFESIQELWSNCDFIVVPYKDKYDIFCLGKTDAIQNLLENSLIDLAQLLSSPNAKSIKGEVQEMLTKLRGLNETFQLLLKLEAEWLRLEPIFNVGDIQRSLPNEFKLYSSTDRFRKGFLKSIMQFHNVMRTLSASGFADSLKKQFDVLDKVSVGLQSYIAAKRAAFPRFFFASDGDLLSVMAKYKQFSAVSEYVNFFFRGIGSVRIVNDGEVSVTEMVSVIGEVVTLLKPAKLRGTPDSWLNDLEDSMRKQVMVLTIDTVATYHEQIMDRWAESSPCQILLLSLNLIMTKSIDAILVTQKQKREKLSELSAHIDQRISILSILLNMRTSDINRNKFELLIASYMHFAWVIVKLGEREENSTTTSFMWNSQLRAYWKTVDGTDQIVYRQLFSEISHDFEFIGKCQLFVVCPEMNRYTISIINAVHNFTDCVIVGQSGVGKTGLLCYLADIFGKIANTVQGFLPHQSSMLMNAVIGSAVCNGWLLVNNSTSLSHETSSMMMHYTETLKSMLGSKDDHVMLEGQAIHTTGIFQVFHINCCDDVAKVNSRKSMHKSFRHVNIMNPNMEDIHNVIFASAGFRNESRLMGKKWIKMCSVSKDRLSQECHNVFNLRVLKRILDYYKIYNSDRSESAFWKVVFNFFCAVLKVGIHEEFRHILHVVLAIVPRQPSIFDSRESHFNRMDGDAMRSSQFTDMIRTHNLGGAILVLGEAASGKSSVLTRLKTNIIEDDVIKGAKNCRCFETIFPNTVERSDLIGDFDSKTKRHTDGIFTEILRRSCSDRKQLTTVIFDGVPLTMWTDYLIGYIESNNFIAVNDNEVIHLPQEKPRLIFETDRIMHVAPAFLDRLSTFFVNGESTISVDFLATEIAAGFHSEVDANHIEFATTRLFSTPFLMECIEFVRMHFSISRPQSRRMHASACIILFTGIVREKYAIAKSLNLDVHQLMMKAFVISVIWTVGGSLLMQERTKFSDFFRTTSGRFDLPRFPNSATVYDYFINPDTLSFCHCKDYNWCGQSEHFVAPVCIASVLLDIHRISVVLVGTKISGKSSLMKFLQSRSRTKFKSEVVSIAFTSHTKASDVRWILDSNLLRISKGVVGSTSGAPVLIAIDDMNATQGNNCCMNSAKECIRQLLDGAHESCLAGTFLDVSKKNCRVSKVQLLATCDDHVDLDQNSRLLHHFFRIYLKPLSTEDMAQIFVHCVQDGNWQPEAKTFLLNCVNMLFDCFISISSKLHSNRDIFWTAPTIHVCNCIMNSIVEDMKCDGVLDTHWANICMYHFSTVFVGMATTMKGKDQVNDVLRLSFKTAYPTSSNADKELHCIIFESCLNLDPSPMASFATFRKLAEEELSKYNATNSPALQMLLSEDIIRRMATFSKALSRNGSHLLVSSPSGYQKYCTLRLLSSMMRHTFWEFDLRVQSRHALNEIIGKLFLSVGGEQDKALLLVKIGFTASWNEDMFEMLSDLHSFIETGDPAGTVSFEDRRKVLETAANSVQSARSSGLENSEILHLIKTRVISNLHLVFVSDSCETQTRDYILGFPAFSNKLTLFTRGSFMKQHEQVEIVEAVIDSLSRISNFDKTEQSQVVKLLGALHVNALHSDDRFSRSNLIACAKMICYEASKYHGEQERKRTCWKTSLQRVQEITAHLKELQLQSLELDSEAKAITLNNEELAKTLEIAQLNLSNVRESLERLLNERKIKNAELQKAQENIRIILEPSQQDSQSALQSLRTLSKSSVNEFTSMESPEQSLQLLGILISLLFGEAPEWKSLRKINTNEGLQVKLFNYDISSIPPRLGRQLLKIIEVSKIDERSIEKVSNVGKVLARWLLACISSIKVTVDCAKEMAERDDLLLLVQGIGSQIESQKPLLVSQKAHAENIQSQFDLSCSNLQSLNGAASECFTKIMRCSKLLEAFENSVPDWASRLEEQNEMEQTYVADLVLACFFISYISILNSSQRQQVMGKSFEICKEENMCCNQGQVNHFLVTSKIVYNEWILCGLPASAFSLENALSIRSSFAWPLIYDPHNIATQWIKQMEQRNNLRVFNCSDIKIGFPALESAIIEGGSILLENIPVHPPSWLVSLISRKIWTLNLASEPLFIDGRNIAVGAGLRVYATSKRPLQELSSFYFGAMTQVNFDVNLETVDTACNRSLASWCIHQKPLYADQVDAGFVQSVKQLLEIDEKRKQMLLTPLATMIQEDSYFIAALQSNLSLSMVTSKLNEAQITVDAFNLSNKKCKQISQAFSSIFMLSQNLKLRDERFFVSFQFFQDLVIKLTEEIKFNDESSCLKLFLQFSTNFFEKIAEMVPPEVFKHFVFDCAIAVCEINGLEQDSESFSFLAKNYNYHVSKSAWIFFENRKKSQIPSPTVHEEHPYLTKQQLEKMRAMEKHIPSLSGILRSVYENCNSWRDWFENGRFAVLKSRPFAQNSRISSCFDSLVILCCMFPSKEDSYIEEFCNLVFKTKAFVHGLNCLSSNNWSDYTNLSYFLIEGNREVDWIEIIDEHLRFWKLVKNDTLNNIEYSIQNESQIERRLSNIIRANEDVVVLNAHEKFSWLKSILTKLSKELDGGLASRVFVVLPTDPLSVHTVPFYSEARKVYCKSRLQFNDYVKLNAEIVLNAECKYLKLVVRKALTTFHSIVGHDEKNFGTCLNIGARTLKNCIITLESLFASAVDQSIAEEDENQSILWAIAAHYGEFARDKIDLERLLHVFCQCIQLESMQTHLTRAETLDVMDVDSFAKGLSTLSILEFCGYREGGKSCLGLEILNQRTQPLTGSDHSQLMQIQTMVPDEILLDNENVKDADWFFKAELRFYNAEIASIIGILEECLQCRANSDINVVHDAINSIINDQVPQNFPNQSQGYSSLRSLLTSLARKRNYFQEWLNRGPPVCHDLSMYYDIPSFLAHVCINSDQTSHQGYEFSLKVLRFENAGDISAMASKGVFVDGLLACRCKWDAKRRHFCSLNAADDRFAKLPICLLSLDHVVHDTANPRRTLPLYALKCDGENNSKEPAVASIIVGAHDESMDIMIGSGAFLACKHHL